MKALKDRNRSSHGLDGTENSADWYYARTQMHRLRNFYLFALVLVEDGLRSLHAERSFENVRAED